MDPPTYPGHAPPGTPTLVETRPSQPDPAPHVSQALSGGGGDGVDVEDALSVMANHVEEMGSGAEGQVMHVPPIEDISERLPSVTGSQSPQDQSNRNDDFREGKKGIIVQHAYIVQSGQLYSSHTMAAY